VIPLRELVKASKKEGYRTWQDAQIKGHEINGKKMKDYNRAEYPGTLKLENPIRIHVGDFVRENYTSLVEWDNSLWSKVWDRVSGSKD
jgi:hypothetical protein